MNMKVLIALCVIAAVGAAPGTYHFAGVPTTYQASGVSYALPTTYSDAAPVGVAVSHALPTTYSGAAPVGVAVSHALPTTYHAVAPVNVAVSHAEVNIPVTKTNVEVPIHQQVQYGTQTYVAGSTTSIHKPSLSALAIAPPTTLLSKVKNNPAELTIKTEEIKVEKHTPNFVETPFNAGTIVKYTEPLIEQVKVKQPVPVPVAQPVAVPQVVQYAQQVVPQAVSYTQQAVVPQVVNYAQQVVPQAVSYTQQAVVPQVVNYAQQAVVPQAVTYTQQAVVPQGVNFAQQAVVPQAVTYGAGSFPQGYNFGFNYDYNFPAAVEVVKQE